MSTQFSKKQVNRAGVLLAALIRDLRSDRDEAVAEYDVDKVQEAFATIDWWRSLHAGPLARVNVGLRYYIAEIHDEPPTQRLKKFSTLIDKLDREPTMKVTTMRPRAPSRTSTIETGVLRGAPAWSIQHFIVVYDIVGRKAEVESRGSDYEGALARYEALEQLHREDPNVEVVMLGSDSLEAIHKTHSSYFELRGQHIAEWVERELAELLD